MKLIYRGTTYDCDPIQAKTDRSPVLDRFSS